MAGAKRDEQVTLAGRVRADSERAPFVDATLSFGGIETTVEHRADFEIETADGVVVVELARHPIVRPERDLATTWAVLKQHPARPDGAFLDDDRGRLRGVWIAPGEPIAVAGYVKDYAFVPDTGTHRDAPERRIRRLRAIAVGLGDTAELALERALRDRDDDLARRARPQVKPNPHAVRSFAYAACCFAVAFSAGYIGVLFAWCGARVEAFPARTVDPEEGPITPNTFLWLTIVLAGGVLPILFYVADDAASRNASLVGSWALLGSYPAWAVARAASAKPDSAAKVVMLPSRAIARWLLVAVLVGLWLAALVIAAPHMTGSPM